MTARSPHRYWLPRSLRRLDASRRKEGRSRPPSDRGTGGLLEEAQDRSPLCSQALGEGDAFRGDAADTAGRGQITDAAGVKRKLSGLGRGNAKGFKVVHSEAEMQTLFEELSAAGKSVQGTGFPGRVVELPDGTTVKFRSFSKVGGSTIEVYYPGRKRPVKVHVE